MERVIIDVVTDGTAGWLVTLTHRGAGNDSSDVVLAARRPMPAVRLDLAVSEVQELSVQVPDPGTMLTTDQLKELLEWMVKGSDSATAPSWATTSSYGSWLHRSLFVSDGDDLWPTIEDIGRSGDGVELALRWASDENNLNRLLWEAMYAPPPAGAPADSEPEPLAGFRFPRPLVAITRLVTPKAPMAVPLPFCGIPRVLFAVGSKFDDPVVRPGAMLLGLLRTFDARSLSVSRVKLEVSLKDLSTECELFDPQVVHLVAHGQMNDVTGEVQLRLHGKLVGSDELLEAIGRPVAVFLSVCDSASGTWQDQPLTKRDGRAGEHQAPLASRLVEGGVPIVVAMAGRVGVSACRLFIHKLVEAVANGEGLIEASGHGRRAALLATDSGGEIDLDWALPTLFMSDVLDPSTSVLDVSAPRYAIDMIRKLCPPRREPQFVGRDDILRTADEMLNLGIAANRRLGFLAITNQYSLSGLGSKIMLSEIARRMVRAGHVPILMAKESAAGSPRTFSELIGNIFQKIRTVRSQFGLELVWPSILGSPPKSFNNSDVDRALDRYRNGENGSPQDVRELILTDVERLLSEVRGKHAPFGPHTHAILLGDEVNLWGDALQKFIEMLQMGGLGRWNTDRQDNIHLPVVVTAVLAGPGSVLKDNEEKLNAAKGKNIDLGNFTEAEAIAAYNWTVLQPWREGLEFRNADADLDFSGLTRQGFVANNDIEGKEWDKVLLRTLKPHPPRVLSHELYLSVMMTLDFGKFIHRIDDADDEAIKQYEKMGRS